MTMMMMMMMMMMITTATVEELRQQINKRQNMNSHSVWTADKGIWRVDARIKRRKKW
jgi:hypothetical protein